MSHSVTIQYIRESIKKELADLYPEREIDAIIGVLCLYRLDLQRHEVGLRKHEILMPPDREWFAEAAGKLRIGVPVQHITGETQFYGLRLVVGPAALIPRPETEELVQWILDAHDGGHGNPEPLRIWDIGTGTGCIALALASHLPGCKIYASDISEDALNLARENSRKLKLDVEFFNHDITGPAPDLSGLDIMVSNPPYIPLREKEALDRNVRDYDPALALFVPDDDPLLFYRHLATSGLQIFGRGGILYLEIHENLSNELLSLLENQGYTDIIVKKDMNGKDRMVSARKP